MTDAPQQPQSALVREMVECIRLLMDTFPLDIEESGDKRFGKATGGVAAKGAGSSAVHGLPDVRLAVTIRWAAHETSRDDKEVLDEIAKAFSKTRIE